MTRHRPDRKPDQDVGDMKGADKGHMHKTLIGPLVRGKIVACCRREFDRAVIGHAILQLKLVRFPSARDLPQLSREGNGGGTASVRLHCAGPVANQSCGCMPYEPALWSSPAVTSAAFWRSVTRSIEKSSIASLNSRWKLSSAPRCRKTPPRPIAARSMKTNSRGTRTGPFSFKAWCTWKAWRRP